MAVLYRPVKMIYAIIETERGKFPAHRDLLGYRNSLVLCGSEEGCTGLTAGTVPALVRDDWEF